MSLIGSTSSIVIAPETFPSILSAFNVSQEGVLCVFKLLAKLVKYLFFALPGATAIISFCFT